MPKYYINKEDGSICNIATNQKVSVFTIEMISVDSFYYDDFDNNINPYLEEGGWLNVLSLEDIEFVINNWKFHEYNRIRLNDFKRNYKKYQYMAYIKNIIE